MSTAIKNPREFWLMLRDEKDERPLVYHDEVKHPALKSLAVHAIEYSAYEELYNFVHHGGMGSVISENDRLRAALSEILDYRADEDPRNMHGGELKHIVFRLREIASEALGNEISR